MQERIERLEVASAIMLGRMNGLASLIVVMARHLSPEVARKCADDARYAIAHIDANRLASPQSDATATEMQEYLLEVSPYSTRRQNPRRFRSRRETFLNGATR